jgi:hypothetical protein
MVRKRRLAMDGKKETIHDRWMEQTEAAYRRMFEGKSREELVTMTQREDLAVSIGKELAALLLEEHVASDPAAEPADASTTCCPKCGQPGIPAAEEGPELLERTVTTLAGEIALQRQRWCCESCRIFFFSAGRSAWSGDGGLQPGRTREGGSSGE